MSKGQKLRALVNERLTAAAEEIFELFERTIAEYEEDVHRFKQRNNAQQQLVLLDQMLEPRVGLHRTGVQFVSGKSDEEVGPSLEPPHIKEEPEEEQLQEFPFTPVSVKTEDDEDNSSVLHQRPTEENREEPNGAEAGCSSDPLTHLHADSEGHTDDSEDWGQDEPPLKTCSSLINPDSSERAAGENPRQHKCFECGKRFRRKYHLKRHMLIHREKKTFKCSVCQKSFSNKSYFIEHVKKHTAVKLFSCSVCKKCFGGQGSLNRHKRVHTGEKPFSCSVCKKEVTQLSSLKSHMRIHTGERPFSCSVCQKTFSNQSYLRRHTRRHATVKPFSCSVCKKNFSDQSYLRKHMIRHAAVKPFSCLVCKKGFTQKYLLYRHMETHTGAGALSQEPKLSERGGAETAGGTC